METSKRELNGFVRFLFDVADIAVFALTTAAIVLTMVFMKFFVSGESMLPTLHDADRLFVYHLFYTPKRGDVVTVESPGLLDKNIVKRIIGVPGDTVELNPEKGQVFVNGKLLDEPYTNTPSNSPVTTAIPKVIPTNSYFVCGDNRNNSLDSRRSEVGLVPREKIMGKVVCIYFPLNRIRVVSTADVV